MDYYFGADSGYSGYNCDNDGESNDGSLSNNNKCAGLVPGDLMISGFKSLAQRMRKYCSTLFIN